MQNGVIHVEFLSNFDIENEWIWAFCVENGVVVAFYFQSILALL
jgi:hypothetical protein